MEERKYSDYSSENIITKNYEIAGGLILKLAQDEESRKKIRRNFA